MQQTADPRTARIVSLAEHRARRAPQRPPRRLGRRFAVGLALGVAIFGMMALFGVAASVALARPHIGVPIGVAVATVASWQVSGAWLAHGSAGTEADLADQHQGRRERHGSGRDGSGS